MQTALFAQGIDVVDTLSSVDDPYAFDQTVWNQGKTLFIGVDEAGRGPLAGPVVAAAVILSPECRIKDLRDSKKIPEKEREILFEQIIQSADGHAIEFADAKEVDRINVLNATLSAMQKAVRSLDSNLPVLVDGNRNIPGIPNKQRFLVKGDRRSASVAAASILAKVARDRYMRQMDSKYPGYNFSRHKGYPTRHHLESLRQHGPSKIHRKTFKGVIE